MLYSKLFLTLGVTWSFEPIFEVLQGLQLCGNICQHFTIGLNAVNLLRGFFFFVIFVCKRSTVQKVRRKVVWGGGPGQQALPLTRVEHARLVTKQSTLSSTLSEAKSSEVNL